LYAEKREYMVIWRKVSLKSALSETRSKQKKRGRILDGFSFFVKIRQIILLDV
jgi:hypothetical protein